MTHSDPDHERAQADVRAMYRDVAAIVGPVFLVGGSVRDLLMGRPCDDYDFATPLRPDEVEAAVRAAGRRPYLTGKRFGTVGFSVSGRKVEVTTFRAESYTPDSRRPEVRYLDDLGDDLARRDFTINAIAMRGDTIIDPQSGRTDIEAKCVRAVGDPSERFSEDPLRMLRAARFASQLGFGIDAATVAGMSSGADHILRVARERRAAELDKLLVGQGVSKGLCVLADTGLLGYLLPELALQAALPRPEPERAGTLWDHTVEAVVGTPPDLTLRWATLLRDVAVPYLAGGGVFARADHCPTRGNEVLSAEIAERVGLHLRWPVARREAVRELVARGARADGPH